MRHVWKCNENMLTCVRVFVGKVRIQNIIRMEYEFFMQMLATSVQETNDLLNVVTLVLESPEILQNPESKMKICEFLKKHKGIIADLSESMKVFL